jgi:hydrogenase maturation factor
VSVSSREERILGIIETARAKRPRFKDERITMAHGAGGKATQTLIEGLLAPAFGIEELGDAAVLDEVALTTDSFVVKPLRFPGGSIGEHGTAIMLARGELGLDADIESDTRPLWPAVDAILGPDVHCLRDATRGGVASVLNELARASRVAIVVRERDVPVRPEVAGAAELLGIDPMYVANEGVLVACVAPDAADTALAALRAHPGCEAAAEIAEVYEEPPGMVLVSTAFGGRRVMDLLAGDPLPRIC